MPPGEYENPLICDSSNLDNVSNALRYSEAIIFVSDYKDAIENAGKGDFVYLDPPYDPVSYSSNFTTYTSNGFGCEEQVQLANVFRKLPDRGCLVLLSNSDTPFIRELYPDFSIKEVGHYDDESLYYELYGTGVRITVVSPIGVKTNFFNNRSFGNHKPNYTGFMFDARTVSKAILAAANSPRLEIIVYVRAGVWFKHTLPYAVNPLVGTLFRKR